MNKIEELILQVDEAIEGVQDYVTGERPEVEAKQDEIAETLRSLRGKLVEIVNPQALHWGVWEYEQQRLDVSGINDKWAHVVRIPSTFPDEQHLEVTFYKGATDGKPVVQIDGQGDFRINVNDAPIWDADPNRHEHEKCSCIEKEEP